MFKATLALEARAKKAVTGGYLTPYSMTLACVVLDMVQDDIPLDLKQDVGCLILNELSDVEVYKERDVVRLVRKVAAYSPDIAENIIVRMTSFICPDDLADFFQEVQSCIGPKLIRNGPNDDPFAFLHKDSIISRFLRRLLLAFDEVLFDGLNRLFVECQNIACRVLQYLDVGEEASEEESRSTPWEKCLTYQQAETYIHQVVERLQAGKVVPQEEVDFLEKHFGNHSSIHYLRYQFALEHCEYEKALDYLHRYFDLCVFSPSIYQNKTQGIISSGVASYALLNLASCELAFHNLDNAELCMQEAIRIAHQNNEDHILINATTAMSHLNKMGNSRKIGTFSSPASLQLCNNVKAELVQPLFCRQLLQYASNLMVNPFAAAPVAAMSSHFKLGGGTGNTSKGLGQDQGLTVPQRIWRSVRNSVVAAHSTGTDSNAALNNFFSNIQGWNRSVHQIHSAALLTAADGWTHLSEYELANLHMDEVDTTESSESLTHPNQIVKAIATKAMQMFQVDGDYTGALTTLCSIPFQLKQMKVDQHFSVGLAPTVYYIIALRAIHTGHRRFAELMLQNLSSLPPWAVHMNTVDSGVPVIQLNAIYGHALLCYYSDKLQMGCDRTKEAIEICQGLNLQSESIRFLLLLCKIHMKLSGNCGVLCIQAVLQCIALSKSLSHTGYYVTSMLQLAHVLLHVKDLAAASNILSTIKRRYLRKTTMEQQAEYFLLSTQLHFTRAMQSPCGGSSGSFSSQSMGADVWDSMNIDGFSSRQRGDDKYMALDEAESFEEGFMDLQRCENILLQLHHLHELGAVYHLRSCMMNHLRRYSERNENAQKFVKLQEVLRKRATQRVGHGGQESKWGGDGALELAYEEIQRMDRER